MSPSILADIYLRPGARILCLATHSKLGLNSPFAEQPKARAQCQPDPCARDHRWRYNGLPIGD